MKDGAGRYIGNRDFGTFGNNAITPASRVTLIGVQAWVEDARTFRVHVCQHVHVCKYVCIHVCMHACDTCECKTLVLHECIDLCTCTRILYPVILPPTGIC